MTEKREEAFSVWLREATEEDVDFYFQIRKLTIKPLIEAYRPWDEDAEKRDIAKKVDIEHDKIIMLGGKAIGGFSYFESDTEIYLKGMNILPEYEVKGLGSNLLFDLKNKADKLNKIITELLKSTRRLVLELSATRMRRILIPR